MIKILCKYNDITSLRLQNSLLTQGCKVELYYCLLALHDSLKGESCIVFYRNQKINYSNYSKDVNVALVQYQELRSLERYYKGKLSDNDEIKNVGNCSDLQLNKLYQMEVAKVCGMDVPDFKVIKPNVYFDSNQITYDNFITKPIDTGLAVLRNEHYFISYTTELKEVFNDRTNFPCLIQKQIQKAYEIRVFVFYDIMYSLCILSKDNTETKVDFRNTNATSSVIYEKYLLPIDLQTKIASFMKKMDLKTGSIDILKSKDGKYYFLEINPFGQFDIFYHSGFPDIYNKMAKIIKNEDCQSD